MVYFSQSDIAAMKAAHEENMRKKAEERAAAEREQSLHDFNEIMTGEDESDDSGIGDEDFLNEDDDSFDFGDDFGDEE